VKEMPRHDDLFQSTEQNKFRLAAANLPLSTVSVYLSPYKTYSINGVELEGSVLVEVLAMTEELLHGSHQKLGYVRNQHLLKKKQWEALVEFNREGDVSALAKEISKYKITEVLQRSATQPHIEAIDKKIGYQTLLQPEYIEQAVRNALAGDVSDEEVDVRTTAIQSIRQEIVQGSHRDQYVNQRTQNRIEELQSQGYDSKAIEAATDAALDLPYIMAVLADADYNWIDNFPQREYGYMDNGGSRDSIAERLRKAFNILQFDVTVDEFRQTNEGADGQIDTDKLRERIKERLSDDTSEGAPVDLTDIYLPLLDMPGDSVESDISDTKSGELAQNTGMAMKIGHPLYNIFTADVPFGVGIFSTSDGGRNRRAENNWQINPWIALNADSAKIAGSEIPAESYEELWAKCYTYDDIITNLWHRVEQLRKKANGQKLKSERTFEFDQFGEMTAVGPLPEHVELHKIECPLCQIRATRTEQLSGAGTNSKATQCGVEGCSMEAMLTHINEQQEKITEEIRRSSKYRRYCMGS
jgi:hypothetical protein